MVAAFDGLVGLCKVCSVSDDEVLNAYVLGSSGITNASTDQSDVDVVVVLRDDAKRKWKNQNWLIHHGWMPMYKIPRKTFKRDYSGSDSHDVWMYSESTFRTLINFGVPFAVECLFLPHDAVWRNTVDFSLTSSPTSIVKSFATVSLMHLRRAGMEFAAHAGRPSTCANLKIESWNLYKSKKTLFFSLRFLEFARQLLENKKITDRESVQEWKHMLMNVDDDLWDTHMQVFQPLHYQCVQALQVAATTADINFQYSNCAPEIQYGGNSQFWCSCEACS